MKDKIKAYKDLLALSEQYSEIFDEDIIVPRTNVIEGIIRALEISERFGIPLKYIGYGGSSYEVENGYDEWSRIAFFGNDAIGCPDDGRQPQDEWLFRIGFGTGAYIFGDSYPKQTFSAFFNELKSFEPKYIDSANKTLYFTEDKAKAVHEAFWTIFKKYKALVADELKAKRKAELEAELAALAEADTK
jgi:hypothetical protein